MDGTFVRSDGQKYTCWQIPVLAGVGPLALEHNLIVPIQRRTAEQVVRERTGCRQQGVDREEATQ